MHCDGRWELTFMKIAKVPSLTFGSFFEKIIISFSNVFIAIAITTTLLKKSNFLEKTKSKQKQKLFVITHQRLVIDGTAKTKTVFQCCHL